MVRIGTVNTGIEFYHDLLCLFGSVFTTEFKLCVHFETEPLSDLHLIESLDYLWNRRPMLSCARLKLDFIELKV